MQRPKTLPVFSESEARRAHHVLATRVAYMMGRKFEEGDWADVYCTAKGIPKKGWSNLSIDIMHGLLGVEHKMLCYRSKPDLRQACGTTLMHPSATRAIRPLPPTADAEDAMVDVLTQYGMLIRQRSLKVREESGMEGEPDMRIGWLLWQESLRQFIYFEEEMLVPDPDQYRAEWNESPNGARRGSRNLWIYERETGKKRYSVTTVAGAKIQPYFDVPPPSDPNICIFTVIGEVVTGGLVRVWVTESTYLELQRLVGDLTPEVLSRIVLFTAKKMNGAESDGNHDEEIGRPLLVEEQAYRALTERVQGVNDDHLFRLLARHLARG